MLGFELIIDSNSHRNVGTLKAIRRMFGMDQ
jgi:hypothetical protein